ncbi:hypothetical protein [Haloarcula montana]|uniref:hypothetical protein n=1 Tax=Haloarcula montana TaxID=3111776 RepID=UPI002D7661CF|nr:hypothetical protein [Haloarcula sp. GH36]
MSDLKPIAFDIETSGLDPDSVITVAGVATDIGSWLALNTNGRTANATALETVLETESGSHVQIRVCKDEETLLRALSDFADQSIDGDRHYLTA